MKGIISRSKRRRMMSRRRTNSDAFAAADDDYDDEHYDDTGSGGDDDIDEQASHQRDASSDDIDSNNDTSDDEDDKAPANKRPCRMRMYADDVTDHKHASLRLGKASVWQRLQSRDDHDVSLTSSSNATDLRASLDRKRRRRC